jgi:hypothetical protein
VITVLSWGLVFRCVCLLSLLTKGELCIGRWSAVQAADRYISSCQVHKQPTGV